MSTLPDNATEPMQKAMQRAVMLRKSMNDVWRAALAELPEPAADTAAEIDCWRTNYGLALLAAIDEIDRLRATLAYAEDALADIGDADREPGDDLAWCESRAAEALPRVRAHLRAPWGGLMSKITRREAVGLIKFLCLRSEKKPCP